MLCKYTTNNSKKQVYFGKVINNFRVGFCWILGGCGLFGRFLFGGVCYQQKYTKIDFFALYRLKTYKNTKKL